MPSLANTSAYLDQLYKEKFGREPDEEGKAYWQGQLDSGAANVASIEAAFDASSEAKDRESKGVAQGVADTESFEAAKAANAAKAPAPAPSPAPAPYNAAEAYNNTVNSTVAAFNAPAASSNNDATLPVLTPDQEKKADINDIYNDVLERNADEEGLNYWYDQLDSGNQTLDQIKDNIQLSKEKDDLADNKAFIEQQYTQGLDRGTSDNVDDAADPYGSGMGHWLKDLATGQSRDDVASNIRRSDEFSDQASDYLSGLYENILERDPDAEGMEYWKQSLIDGTQTRTDVENNFNISDEKWLGDIYKDELGRNLGEDGRKYWLDDLKGLNEGQGGKKATREEVLANIKRSDEYSCAQSGGTWDGSECKQGLAPCPEGQTRPPGSTSCAPIPTNCPDGTTWDGTTCRATGAEEGAFCSDGSFVSDPSECPTTPAPCPSGQSRGDDGQCKPDVTIPEYHTCPDGSKVINPADCSSGGGGEEEEEETVACPNGQVRNADGTCPDSGTYMGDDPQDKIDTEGNAPGTWMGNQESDDDFNRLYNDKQAEMIRLYGGDGQGGTASNDRYDQLKSDYDDARREADSYINANRDEELSKLRRGITVGGFPGSRRNDLRSGGTAYSDRSKKRSRITAGPRVKNDRPYAPRGVRGGYSSGSTYFDNASSF